ncbi:MAG: pyruvate dehydrogenase complex dihydrolipoamide acetyltransferase [Planctomycetota bacterium]
MAINVTMPRLSDTMEQGTVVKWHVKQGDEVSAGDVLADIETDKATMELECFDDGTVAKLAIDEGQQIAVGETILIIAEDGESVDEAAASGSASAPAAKQAGGSDTSTPAPTATAVAEPPAATNGASTNGATGRVFASPLARKIAGEAGLDLSSLSGTGPSGRIVKKDVEAAISAGGVTTASVATSSAPAPAPAPLPPAGASLEARTVPLSNMRGVIARRLVESKTTVPHYQVTVEVDMDPLLDLRKQLNEQLATQGVKLSVNDFLVRACGLAMHQHPYVNSSWDGSTNPPSIRINGEVNIGVAVSLPEEKGGGLVVATIRGADRNGLRQISADTKALATKAREKGLSPQEMDGSTFTISNLGMFGVDHFTAIINPPNSAILAVGAAVERPVVKNGEIVVGHVMSMTMSSDHRIIDGAMAAQYLATVRQLLEQPATLLV